MRPVDILRALGPQEREIVARWLEAYIPGLEHEMAAIADLMAQGREYAGAAASFTRNRIMIQSINHFAWVLRTGRGGPLAGQARKKRQNPPE
jgi:hypothetical protein